MQAQAKQNKDLEEALFFLGDELTQIKVLPSISRRITDARELFSGSMETFGKLIMVWYECGQSAAKAATPQQGKRSSVVTKGAR